MSKISVFERFEFKINNLEPESEDFQEKGFKIAINLAKTNVSKISEKSKIKLYESLVGKNINLFQTDNNGNNLFYYAIHGFEKDYLFDKGLSITAKNNFNMMMATYLPVDSLKKCLIKGVEIPEDDFADRDQHPFFENKGRTFIKIKDYIKDINMKNTKGENVAFIANSHRKVISELLEAGVDFHSLNNNGENILFKSSIRKIETLIELDIKLDINLKNKNGKNPFEIQFEKIKLMNSRINEKELILSYRRMNSLVKYAIFSKSPFPSSEITNIYRNVPDSVLFYKSEFENMLISIISKEMDQIRENISENEENPKIMKRL